MPATMRVRTCKENKAKAFLKNGGRSNLVWKRNGRGTRTALSGLMLNSKGSQCRAGPAKRKTMWLSERIHANFKSSTGAHAIQKRGTDINRKSNFTRTQEMHSDEKEENK